MEKSTHSFSMEIMGGAGIGRAILGDHFSAADQDNLRTSPLDGIEIEFRGLTSGEHGGLPALFEFTVNVAGDVAIGVFSAWLYNRLRDRNIKHFLIEREEVEIDEDKIKIVLEKIIQREDK